MSTNVDDGVILDSAFLTCCIVSVNGHTSSFKVDCNRKVVDAFRKFALECGFGWTDNPKNEHAIEVRIGDRGWSVTATAIDGYDLNCNGVFTATGQIPVEVLEMTGNAKHDSPKSFVHGNKVIDGNPFSDTLEFASASKAKNTPNGTGTSSERPVTHGTTDLWITLRRRGVIPFRVPTGNDTRATAAKAIRL